MTDKRYCTECGRELLPGDRFCPGCGANIDEDTYWGEVPEGAVVATASVKDMSGTLNTVKILTLVWGAVALFTGLMLFASVGMLDEVINELSHTDYDGTQTVWEYLVSQGFDKDFFQAFLIGAGAIITLSGVFAIISGVLDHMRKHYKASFVCLVLSIIFSGSGLICIAVGVIVAVYLTKCKCEFES